MARGAGLLALAAALLAGCWRCAGAGAGRCRQRPVAAGAATTRRQACAPSRSRRSGSTRAATPRIDAGARASGAAFQPAAPGTDPPARARRARCGCTCACRARRTSARTGCSSSRCRCWTAVTVYQQRRARRAGARETRRRHAGRGAWPEAGRYPVFRLDLPPGEARDVYVRIRHTAPASVPAAAHHRRRATASSIQLEYLGLGLAFGAPAAADRRLPGPEPGSTATASTPGTRLYAALTALARGRLHRRRPPTCCGRLRRAGRCAAPACWPCWPPARPSCSCATSSASPARYPRLDRLALLAGWAGLALVAAAACSARRHARARRCWRPTCSGATLLNMWRRPGAPGARGDAVGMWVLRRLRCR